MNTFINNFDFLSIDEILQYKLKMNKNFFNLTTLNILSFIILLFFIKFTYDYLNNDIYIIIFILLIYIILLIINNKLKTNKHFSKKYIKHDEIKDKLNTGDIILFKSFEYGKFSYALFTFLLCLVQDNYFTHIGMIYKDSNNKVYIIETNEKKIYCELDKKYKSGFQMINYDDRIKNNKTHRIHLIKNNLHKYINNTKLLQSITKYKNYEFNQDGVHCLNLIINILQENNLLQENLLPYVFEDLLKSSNYSVPIVFDEPVCIKEFY